MPKPLFCLDESTLVFFCPLCGSYIDSSHYLHKVFGNDEKTEWVANMVTHYRHGHIDYYNRSISNPYYNTSFDYERDKPIINNRVKRQIIRKLCSFLISHSINVEHFKKLQETDNQTLELAIKKLGMSQVNNSLENFIHKS